MSDDASTAAVSGTRQPVSTIFLVFLRLGLTSFGGPVAHLGYFREEFVNRRKWMDDRTYADLVALCQFTPGAASSKVGIGIGLSLGGLPGALAAWLAFTAPSAIVLILFGFGVTAYGEYLDTGVLRGLKIVAVAVVALAVWGMAKNLCPDPQRATMAVGAALVFTLWPSSAGQLGAIAAGALIGLLFLKDDRGTGHVDMNIPVGRKVATVALLLFFGLLFGLPFIAAAMPGHGIDMVDSFYRTGSLVFGGGHVVLPLIQAEVVPPGWVGNDEFLAGYGAAQAVPGPLFTFAAFLGTVSGPAPNGVLGAIICLIAIFLPSFLLTVGVLPFWDHLRSVRQVRSALIGVNAVVVGLLVAALYNPVWTSAIRGPEDFALAIVAFLMLAFWKLPPWLVVILCGAGGWAVATFLPALT